MMTDRSQFLYTEAGELVDQVKKVALNLENPPDLDPLLDRIGEAHYVFLGSASYGTSEYYTWRARLSQRLIAEKGFSFIAVEGDWSDCAPVNRYIKGYPSTGESALEVLDSLQRWPSWRWANWEMVALVEWLRHYNDNRPDKVGFYGLDRYSLWEAMQVMIGYLEQVDPEAAETARRAWVCFEPYARDVQADTGDIILVPPALEEQVIQLLARRHNRSAPPSTDLEGAFEAEQNVLLAENAESYYRTLLWGNVTSWNLRAHHLVDTLDRLMAHHGSGAKAIIWAHNSHVVDARTTDMAKVGRINMGQLVREWHDDTGVLLVGQGTYRGSVIAAQNWGAPPEWMPVPQAPDGSWEDVLHQAGANNKLLLLKDIRNTPQFLELRGHRAIGAIYNTARERFSSYIPIVLTQGYDAFLYFDETQALHPLHLQTETQVQQPEMYPWGLSF